MANFLFLLTALLSMDSARAAERRVHVRPPFDEWDGFISPEDSPVEITNTLSVHKGTRVIMDGTFTIRWHGHCEPNMTASTFNVSVSVTISVSKDTF